MQYLIFMIFLPLFVFECCGIKFFNKFANKTFYQNQNYLLFLKTGILCERWRNYEKLDPTISAYVQCAEAADGRLRKENNSSCQKGDYKIAAFT